MVSLSMGFRGLTASQTDLVRHWYACCQDQALPQREWLDPGAIRAHLACISIVEVEPCGEVRFRLAGSGLRQVLGREMRGRLLSELDQTLSDMWSLGLSNAIEQMRPVGGLIEREFDAHAWLRLPLYSARSGALVMCHDALIASSAEDEFSESQSRTNNRSFNILAA